MNFLFYTVSKRLYRLKGELMNIYEQVNELVYGHHKVKKLLINALYKAHLRRQQIALGEEELIDTDKLLIIGDTGTGKSFLVNQLFRIAKKPLFYVDCSSLSPAGGSGFNINDLKKNIVNFLLENEDLNCSQSIIFFDEVDKLAKEFGSSEGWRRAVQEGILSMIDGYEDFSNLTFVFAGAFVGLKKEEKVKQLGFTNIRDSGIKSDITEDLVTYGFLPELVGRFTAVSELDSFDIEDFKTILDDFILPKYRKELYMLGIQHEFCLESMAKNAQKLGVRALKRNINEEISEKLFELSVNASV